MVSHVVPALRGPIPPEVVPWSGALVVLKKEELPRFGLAGPRHFDRRGRRGTVHIRSEEAEDGEDRRCLHLRLWSTEDAGAVDWSMLT